MGLVAFMKTSDPNRISKITAHVEDRSLARDLIPARQSTPETRVYEKIVVADCQTHIGGVSVPVELRTYNGNGGYTSIGIARCCPLCWRVVVGVDGEKEPPVKPLIHTAPEKKAKPPKSPRKPRPVVNKQGDDRNAMMLAVPQLRDWKGNEWFTTQEAMARFNISRPSASTQLGQLVRFGMLEVIPGGGRGVSSKYRLMQKKEA